MQDPGLHIDHVGVHFGPRNGLRDRSEEATGDGSSVIHCLRAKEVGARPQSAEGISDSSVDAARRIPPIDGGGVSRETESN